MRKIARRDSIERHNKAMTELGKDSAGHHYWLWYADYAESPALIRRAIAAFTKRWGRPPVKIICGKKIVCDGVSVEVKAMPKGHFMLGPITDEEIRQRNIKRNEPLRYT